MAGPCTGLTVLDFSLGMPGALCTLVMADYGADVVRLSIGLEDVDDIIADLDQALAKA